MFHYLVEGMAAYRVGAYLVHEVCFLTRIVNPASPECHMAIVEVWHLIIVFGWLVLTSTNLLCWGTRRLALMG